jgi:hypothetical protein
LLVKIEAGNPVRMNAVQGDAVDFVGADSREPLGQGFWQ